jgi:hypothetical protein
MNVAFPPAIPGEPIMDTPITHETKHMQSDNTKELESTAGVQDASNVPSQVEQTSSTIEQSGWLSSILLFNREEPAEVAELRKRVEEEEIKRYMTNFQKVSPNHDSSFLTWKSNHSIHAIPF